MIWLDNPVIPQRGMHVNANSMTMQWSCNDNSMIIQRQFDDDAIHDHDMIVQW